MQPIMDLLPDFQADLYIRGLLAIADADGIDPSEMDYIRQQATGLGVDVDTVMQEGVPTLDGLGEGCSAFTRRIILRDCIILAYADGVFSKEERAMIDQLCDRLSLDRGLVPRFEAWLARYDEVLNEGARLLEE